jgi:hypothetical protein
VLLTIKQFATLWSDTPRWARGLFLGNLGSILLTGLGFTLIPHSDRDQTGLFVALAPILWPRMLSTLGSGLLLFHAAWCVLSAILVQRFGEMIGMLIMIVLPCVVGIPVILYDLTHFSFRF